MQNNTQKISNEINLLYRLMNSIRKASKDLHDLRAAHSFQLLDDDGNSIERTLQDSFERLLQDYCHSEISENLLSRLAWSMVARRKRILYRRSRYGKSPVQVSKPVPRPVITPSVAGYATGTLGNKGDSGTLTKPTQILTRSIAPTATTLNPEKYRIVSSASVISRSKTIDLSNHDPLSFPDPPCIKVIKRYKRYEKERRLELVNASLNYTGHGPSEFDETSKAEAELERDLVRYWRSLNNGRVEVGCPICFYALPRTVVLDAENWK